MRHQSQNRTRDIGDACDVGHGPIGVGAVAQGDGVVVLKLLQRVVTALESPLSVGDGQ